MAIDNLLGIKKKPREKATILFPTGPLGLPPAVADGSGQLGEEGWITTWS
jgi:hypothetical protein